MDVYLTTGQMKTLVAELNASKLGPKFAQWIQSNETRLVRHPALQPQKPLAQVVREAEEQAVVSAEVAYGQITRASYDNFVPSVRARGVRDAIDAGFDTTNLQNKLQKYVLDATHPQNQTKAIWFQRALGFDKSNWERLASQIKFNEANAAMNKTNQYGQTFVQKTPIVGTNGKTINVPFVFLKDRSGVVRLVTGIPAKQ